MLKNKVLQMLKEMGEEGFPAEAMENVNRIVKSTKVRTKR